MRFIKFGILAAALGFVANAAMAAPQMLGLVATNAAAPLYCEGGVCTAEISTFCLQEHRGEPARGTAYNLVDPAKIILVARAADGRNIRRTVGHMARLTVARGQYALRISLPQDMLMGSRDASIVVAPLAIRSTGAR